MSGKASDRYSRRAVIKALGLGPALLPALRAGRAEAGCLAQPPKRLVVVVWTNGVLQWVSGSGSTFSLPDTMKSLDPYKSDLLPIRGVRLQTLRDTPNPQNADSAGHGATPAVLTGRQYAEFRPFVEIGGGPSIDQYVAAALQRQGASTPKPYIVLGVLHEGYISTWRAAREPITPDSDPYHVFDTLFAGSAGRAPDPMIEKLRLARKSVLDNVVRDLERFKGRVGTDHQQRIDAHLTSVREIEKGLVPPPGGGPQGCTVPTLPGRFDVKSTRNFPAVFKAQMDLLVAALAADVTRVAVIQTGNEGNNHVVPTWLGIEPTGKGGGLGDENSHHSIAHAAGGNANDPRKTKIDAWFHEQFAYLIGKLKAEKEANGKSMLESTCVLIVNHMDNGAGHGIGNIPVLIAGQCGGYFSTGRNIQVGDIMHTHVLGEVGRAMGVDMKDFFGAGYAGELPALRA